MTRHPAERVPPADAPTEAERMADLAELLCDVDDRIAAEEAAAAKTG